MMGSKILHSQVRTTVVPVGLETVNYIQLPPSLCLGARGAKPVLVAPGPMGAFSAPIAPGQRCG
ncbi:hypothetical protein N658DRAFT_491338 [Parathielavia hyrcaniae]|uniref:Uncharacterized protein n=1 Tax=Parathielavia hyrcaniae TaxID=113614 RepID=A0AAN6T683_9PEZI|nr:hypothetical protein N658DRAFT_491338 [Parathielavia hyrcaniae]